jgi:hypothetical protein
LWGKKTLSEALKQALKLGAINQTLELEAADIAEHPPGFGKRRPGHSGGGRSPQWNEQVTDSLHAGAEGAPATFERPAPTNPTKTTTTNAG